MNSGPTENLKDTFHSSRPVRPCFRIGKNVVVIIDNAIVQELGISESDTYVQEEITADGILLRIRRVCASVQLDVSKGCESDGSKQSGNK
jgi:hypothetical protein